MIIKGKKALIINKSAIAPVLEFKEPNCFDYLFKQQDSKNVEKVVNLLRNWTIDPYLFGSVIENRLFMNKNKQYLPGTYTDIDMIGRSGKIKYLKEFSEYLEKEPEKIIKCLQAEKIKSSYQNEEGHQNNIKFHFGEPCSTIHLILTNKGFTDEQPRGSIERTIERHNDTHYR